MPTQDEKINEIYEYIEKKKKQEKRELITKWIIRIFFLGYILYSVFVLIPSYMEKYKGPIKQFKDIISNQKLENIGLEQEKISETIKKYIDNKKNKNLNEF